MKFEFSVETKPQKTFRVESVRNAYDISFDKFVQKFHGDIAIEGTKWSIGLIVGSSGSGKSSIAKKLFGEFDQFDWSKSKNGFSLLDDFEPELTSAEIQQTLSSVGFSSPTFWLKPFHVLSNGEKMRVELARSILQKKSPILFDEFTSVVDRQVAKVTSVAIAKAVRRSGKQFIAVSCHRDIVEWLCPDWVYDTDEQRFFFAKSNDPKSRPQFTNAIAAFGPVLKNITI